MSYLLYLIFRCDKKYDGCDEKFGNFVGTKHTLTQQPTAADHARSALLPFSLSLSLSGFRNHKGRILRPARRILERVMRDRRDTGVKRCRCPVLHRGAEAVLWGGLSP